MSGYSSRSLRILYRALSSASGQLAVLIRRLNLESLPAPDVKTILSQLFLMPNLTELSMVWENYIVPPQLDVERQRPRLIRLSLIVWLDDVSDWSLFAPTIGGLLDLHNLEHLELLRCGRPSLCLEQLGLLLPVTLQRLSIETVSSEDYTACIRIIASKFKLLRRLYLDVRLGGQGWPCIPLATLFDALPSLRCLELCDICLDDLIGQARHPMLQRLDLIHNYDNEREPSSGFPPRHALQVVVDDVCHRRRENAFPSLQTMQLSSRGFARFNILSFATEDSRRRMGVADMARKLKDVGVVLRDEDDDEPWRDE